MVTQLALGVRGMMIEAVEQHRREFQGELPRAIRMHPLVRCEWLTTMKSMERFERTIGPDGGEYWRGIRIIETTRAKGLQIINANNVIEDL
jgi:hypothetical protein